MRFTYTFIIGLMLTARTIYAQDFNGDSIYYTPIPRGEGKRASSKKVSDELMKSEKHLTYFFNLQVGPLVGCSDCGERKEVTFTSATIHGVSIGRKLRTGLGIGFDSYYLWQTMPIFGSASWDLVGSKNTNALFLQVNYGWAKPWLTQSAQDGYGYKDTTGGRMISTQLGYRVNYHDLKISFAFGSKFQRAYANFEYPTYFYRFDGSPVQGTSSTKKVEADMNRLMLSLAIGWR